MKARNAAIAALAAVLCASAGVATAGDDATSMSYISYLERYATLRPAHEGETLEAQINMPVLAGDRLETSRGARVEVVLADGSSLWLDEFTTVDFDALTFSREAPAERNAIYLASGAIIAEIPDTALGNATTRVETSAGVVHLHKPGLYRLDADGNGLHVVARAGLAELPAGLGSSLLRPGQEAWLDGVGGLEKSALAEAYDDFWTWVAARRTPTPSGQTAAYVDARAAGRAAVLDNYGDWVYVNSFSSWMWRPRVSVTWSPYTYGRWYWTPAGWTWISYEPWGWYPSHYGSWYLDTQFGWVWCWDLVWGPAWVHWIYTPGYVGWCPRGYYDWWYWNQHPDRHYGHRWTRSALDFSGRVRLRDVDPRPWTIVSAGDFGSSHLDRVRIDARRVLRDVPDGREGFVRSGPLVTPTRSVGSPSDLFDRDFRGTDRTAPGLGTLLGRGGNGGGTVGTLPVRSIDTAAAVRVPERGAAGPLPGGGLPGGRTEAGTSRSPRGTAPGTTSGGERTTITRRSTSSRTGSGESGSSTGSPPPPTTSRPASPPSTSRPSLPPPAARPSSPPPAARPSDEGGRDRDSSATKEPVSFSGRTPVAVVRGVAGTRARVEAPASRRDPAVAGQAWPRSSTVSSRNTAVSSRAQVSSSRSGTVSPRSGSAASHSGTPRSGSWTRPTAVSPSRAATARSSSSPSPSSARSSSTHATAPRSSASSSRSGSSTTSSSSSSSGRGGRTSSGAGSRRR